MPPECEAALILTSIFLIKIHKWVVLAWANMRGLPSSHRPPQLRATEGAGAPSPDAPGHRSLGTGSWPRGPSGLGGGCGPAAARTGGQTPHTAAISPCWVTISRAWPNFSKRLQFKKWGRKHRKKRNFQKFPDSKEARSTGTAGFSDAAPRSGVLSPASLTLSPSGSSENGLNALLGREAIFHSSYSNLWSSLNLYVLCLAPLCAAHRNPRAVAHSKELITLSTGAA